MYYYTSADYTSNLESLKAHYKIHPELVAASLDLVERNISEEESFVRNYGGLCPSAFRGDYRTNIHRVNEELIKHDMGKQYYNFEAVQATACLVDSLLYSLPGTNGTIGLREMIRDKVTGLKRIGEPSAYGYVLSGGMDNVNDLFALKVSQNNTDESDLLHEAFVTMSTMNKLREIGIPNFAVVYGAFFCSGPIIDDKTNRVVEWCSPGNKNKVAYLIYENITPSSSMSNYNKTATVKQFLSALLQVACATDAAEKRYGYTHYDLHTSNVLARSATELGLGKVFQIPYQDGNGKVMYVASEIIATIIDFGMSVVKYGPNGKYYGTPEKTPDIYSRYSDRSWGAHDIYKYLLFCARYLFDIYGNVPMMPAQQNRKLIINEIRSAYTYFSKEPLESAVVKQWNSRYSLPYIKGKTSRFTVPGFISHVLVNCSCAGVVSSKPFKNLSMLECRNCLSLGSISTSAGAVKSVSVPKSFIEYYDMTPYIVRQSISLYEKMRKSFKYVPAKDSYIKRLNSILEDARAIILSIDMISVSKSTIFNYDTLTKTEDAYVKAFALASKIEDMQTNINVGAWMAQVFRDRSLRDVLVLAEGYVKDLNSSLCDIVKNIIEAYVLAHSDEAAFYAAHSKNKKLKWYITTGPRILDLKDRVCFPIGLNATPLIKPIYVDGKVILKAPVPEFNGIPIHIPLPKRERLTSDTGKGVSLSSEDAIDKMKKSFSRM